MKKDNKDKKIKKIVGKHNANKALLKNPNRVPNLLRNRPFNIKGGN